MITRPRTRRRAPALLVAVLLAGCASSRTVDAGSVAAVPDQSYVNSVQAKQFDTDYARMDKALVDGHPVRGTMYKHASFGSKSEDEEWDVEFLGDPAAVFTRTRVKASDAGDNLDMYHPAGSPYDYFLLGNFYQSIAKTPWARVASNYSGEPLNVCLVTGYQTVCDIEDTVTYTAQEHAEVIKRVTRNSDGTVTLLTGVTLQSLLKDNFLLNIPTSISSQFTPAMLKYQLAARFVIDGRGRIQIASVTGTVPGTTPFQVQVGYQVTGAAQKSDLPSLPPATQVTPVAKATFYHRLDQLNGA